jgi:hypothetical protein
MATIPFNISLGELKEKAKLLAANDALVFVLIETTGIETDATLRDYDDLSALLAGTSNEQTNQSRKSVTSTTITVDDTNDRTDIDVADQTYVALGGNAISALLICHDADTTTGNDTNIQPISKHDWTITPDGSDVTAQIATAGFMRIQSG